MKLVNDARGNVFEYSLGGSTVSDDVKARVRKQKSQEKMRATAKSLGTWVALFGGLAAVVGFGFFYF